MFGRLGRRAGDTVIGKRGANALVLAPEDAMRHTMVFGTGSPEKREVMLDFVDAAAADGAGALLIDGSGDVAVRARVTEICRRNGRLEDLRFIDFRQGGVKGSYADNKANVTIDPFADAPPDVLASMIVAMLPDAGGDGAMWKGRATAMFTGVMRGVCWLRDIGQLELDAAAIMDWIDLRQILELADIRKYPDMPAPVRKSIRSYLTSLPGYQEEKGARQAQTTMDQHGYLAMQFTRILGTLSDAYGHAFSASGPTIRVHDIITRRLVTVVLLPALEAAPENAGSAGRIILGAFRQAVSKMASEGVVHDGGPPFRVVLADLPYYVIVGMAQLMQASRHVGMAVVASADSPALFTRINRFESLAMGDNTWNRVYLRMGSSEAVEHIRELPIPAVARNRIVGMPMDRAAFLSGGYLRFIQLPVAA